MRTYFDSANYSEAEQYSAWCQAHATAFYPLDGEPQHRSSYHKGFAARLRGMRLGALNLMEIRSAPVLYRHSRKHLRCQPNEDLFVSLMLGGLAHLQEDQRSVTQRPGDIVVWGSRQPTRWDLEHALHSFVVRVPRSFAQARTAQGDRLSGGVLPGDSAIAQLAAEMITGAARLGDLPADSSAARRLGTSLLDIVIAGLEMQSSGSEGRDRLCDGLQRAKDYLLARLDDADMCVEKMAVALNVSTRTLNRMFAAEGQTAMRWLWQQRLETSQRMLSEGRNRRVTDVALACGFKSFSHFSHAFRRAYAVAPSTVALGAKV